MLNILAWDTSTPRAALGLATAAGAVYVATPDPAPRHGRNLVPALRDLVRAAGLVPGDLDCVAVGLGPGSYTGLRIGLTAAKLLVYATGKPLIGFDSLEAIARNAAPETLRVAVVADAQRGDVYLAEFARDAPGGPFRRIAPTRIGLADQWRTSLPPGTSIFGPATERRRDLPPETPPLAENFPDGRQLLGLAREIWDSGRRDDPWSLEPLYLRRSAAEDQWDQRATETPS